MRFNLYFTHWSLFCITIISSSFLFFVVATENAKYVAAAAAAQAAAGSTFDEAAAAANSPANGANSDVAPAAASLNSDTPHEKILPNYKKVKKVDSPAVGAAAAEPSLATVPIATPSVEEFPSSPSLSPTGSLTDKNTAHDSEHVSSGGVQSADVENTPSVLLAEEVIKDQVIDKPIVTENDEGDHIVPAEDENEILSEQSTVSSSSESNDNHIEQPASQPLESSGDILPDITEIPTITTVHEFTDLPLEVLEPSLNGVDSQLIQGSPESARMNRTLELLIGNSEEVLKDDEIIKINDSGGIGSSLEAAVVPTDLPTKTTENIPRENGTDENLTESNPNTTTQEEQAQQQPAAGAQPTPNTAEEVPIPVFSEWAQKQMEAAEKQQQLEQDVVNTSTQKKNNNTNGNGKLPPLKLRAKNYASPDCGAKIIASNSDATNTGALLSSSKDEYMLSPCTNRIWFVVELCEAIQAQKIDLANFELFSSSPRNFTVAVSNRFPTREWSNVGRFIAEDKRTVQSFDLHPHLFGKFVRVDIHSHYSKEHFCPLSLFRVFGTSEFEAFETENHPNEDLDDFDDEFGLEQAHVKNSENNLFKSASDAVLSIVKKAAEVLAKPSSNTNASLMLTVPVNECQTPAFGQFSCAECNHELVERVNTVISCKYKHLKSLLSIPRLRSDLLNSQTCATNYGIETSANVYEGCRSNPRHTAPQRSYYLNLLPAEYVGALCQLITEKSSSASPPHQQKESSEDAELALNLTIDKKQSAGDFKIIENVKGNKKPIIKSDEEFTIPPEVGIETNTQTKAQQTATVTESSQLQDEQLARPPKGESPISTTTSTESSVIEQEVNQDVNIFNVNPDDSQPQSAEQIEIDEHRSSQQVYEGSGDHLNPVPSVTTTEAPSATVKSNEDRPATSTEDPSSWDSIDHLLTSTTVAPGSGAIQGGNSQSGGGGNGVNMQQKIPNGPHSESIFIRLSNRIKALERNMSLSGQYLEELSRRYKKQAEDLQQTLTQQSLNVRTLEEQSRRHHEYEQLLSQRNMQLKEELDDLTLQVHACIIVIIFVGAFVFLVVMVGILFIRSMRRETRELVALQMDGVKRKSAAASSASVATQRKLNRRKSFEDFSDHQQPFNKTTEEKQRRPSEEAMLILKECGDSKRAAQELSEMVGDARQEPQMPRQRKISVCYGNNNNNSNCSINGNSKACNNKRKGEKTSWPNSEKSQQQARQHLEELNGAEDYDTFSESNLLVRQSSKSKVNSVSNGKSTNESNGQRNKQSKKKLQNVKRQMSVPIVGNNHSPLTPLQSGKSFEDNDNVPIISTSSDYDESLMLDEDDLNNFLPCSDLAYNEFMPEGPSGYQISTNTNDSNSKLEKTKKSRRLSSPAFFKSPFGKSLKSKSPTTTSATPPHESTSWEWYRLKKSDPHKHTATTTNNSLRPSASSSFNQRSSPAASVDSSSLSEINFPTNSNENSFRILEEAILSSTGAAAVTNGNDNSSSSGGSSSIRSTSTTSSKKKKNRSFKIFRKVF